MTIFFIKKMVEAGSVIEALSKEGGAEIIEVWKKEDEGGNLTSAIGFEFNQANDEEENSE